MARLLIVGSGVVGQATGKGFTKKGHAVSYVDISPSTIAKLRADGLNAMLPSEVDWKAVDIIMLAVSTPSIDGEIVLDYIEAAAMDVGRGLAQIDHFVPVVVRSTVPPTTTEQRITPILERASDRQAGVDFGVAMNPEFLRQVSSEQDFMRAMDHGARHHGPAHRRDPDADLQRIWRAGRPLHADRGRDDQVC